MFNLLLLYSRWFAYIIYTNCKEELETLPDFNTTFQFLMHENINNPSSKLLAAIADVPESSDLAFRIDPSLTVTESLMLDFLQLPPVSAAQLFNPSDKQPNPFLKEYLTAPSVPNTPSKPPASGGSTSAPPKLTMDDKESFLRDAVLPAWKPKSYPPGFEFSDTIACLLELMPMTCLANSTTMVGASSLSTYKVRLQTYVQELLHEGAKQLEGQEVGPGSYLVHELQFNVVSIDPPSIFDKALLGRAYPLGLGLAGTKLLYDLVLRNYHAFIGNLASLQDQPFIHDQHWGRVTFTALSMNWMSQVIRLFLNKVNSCFH